MTTRACGELIISPSSSPAIRALAGLLAPSLHRRRVDVSSLRRITGRSPLPSADPTRRPLLCASHKKVRSLLSCASLSALLSLDFLSSPALTFATPPHHRGRAHSNGWQVRLLLPRVFACIALLVASSSCLRLDEAATCSRASLKATTACLRPVTGVCQWRMRARASTYTDSSPRDAPWTAKLWLTNISSRPSPARAGSRTAV